MIATGDAANRRADTAPVARKACTMPSRSGASHACSATTVMARLWSSHTRPPPNAHSTSCGPWNNLPARAARSASARRSRRSGDGPSPTDEIRRPRRDSTRWRPVTSPPTRALGLPGATSTTRWPSSPSTGSAPNSTPPCSAASWGWISTARGLTASTPSRAAESRTARTAATTPSHPPHVEDRPEAPRHRGVLGVLDGRRRPDHERPDARREERVDRGGAGAPTPSARACRPGATGRSRPW